MFTKCQDVKHLDPKKGENKLFQNVLCKGRIQNFFQGSGRGPHFHIFFWQSYFEVNRGTKTALGGYGGMLPQRNNNSSAFCIIFKENSV